MRETESGASGGVGRRPGPAGGAAGGEADGAGTGGYEPAAGGAAASETAPPQPIPTPWSVKWDRFSHGLLPVIVFVIALAFTIYLWRRHTGLSSVVGEVDARNVTVASTAAGTLTEIGKNKISKYERVQQGEVIARLEVGGELQRRLALRQELDRLEQALAGVAVAPATAPAGAAPTTGPVASPAEVEIRAAIAASKRELDRIQSTIQASDIRAPITGRVTQVYLHPGQSVLPGQAIMEIVEEHGSHIIAFVRSQACVPPPACPWRSTRGPAANAPTARTSRRWAPASSWSPSTSSPTRSGRSGDYRCGSCSRPRRG